MTSLIQTASGAVLPLSGIIKLHIGEAPDTHDTEAVYADTSLVGTVAKGGNAQILLDNLTTRAACSDGVFGIRDGAVYRRYALNETRLIVSNYGTGENAAWGSSG